MQTKDLIVGEEYVLAENYCWGESADTTMEHLLGWQGTRNGRVRIEKTGVPMFGWSSRTTRDNGVLVTLLDVRTGAPLLTTEGKERTAVVRPNNIRQQWAPFAIEAERQGKANKKRQEEVEHLLQATRERLQEVLDKSGISSSDANLPFNLQNFLQEHGVHVRGEIRATSLAHLLEKAYAAGAERGER